MSVITEMIAKWCQLLQRWLQSHVSYYRDDCKVMLVITDMTAKRGASYFRDDCRERCQLLQRWLQREVPVISEMTAERGASYYWNDFSERCHLLLRWLPWEVPVIAEMIAVRGASYNRDDCKVMLVITDMTSKRGASYFRNDSRVRCHPEKGSHHIKQTNKQMIAKWCHYWDYCSERCQLLLRWLQWEVSVITEMTTVRGASY